MTTRLISALCLAAAMDGAISWAQTPAALRLGRAAHAFDHLGAIGEQAPTAAASGATVIYATGLGSSGYSGWPPANELADLRDHTIAYNRQARSEGIELIIGYVCATSITKIESFDKNWPDELRNKLSSPPAEWRQCGRDGQPLPSWYGGEYRPACMNHPDWRTYEEFVARQQLETGHDGIFFDNPTVHPEGCYCPHCMEKFAAFVKFDGQPAAAERLAALRQLAADRPQDFLRFRAGIARDFLAHMRAYARTIKPDALVTCNNSLNAPQVLFSQARTYGYNIQEMSRVEDLVVVEDMATQPRAAGGSFVEYGPTYRLIAAISHGKPVVAVTLAEGDYHTPPQLVRLAMAEAAAHGASYLSWPTWPEAQRAPMAAAIRPQAALLRRGESLLNDAQPRADVILFLPFRRWVETDRCVASDLAAALTRANVQYTVVADEEFSAAMLADPRRVLLVESLAVLRPPELVVIEAFKTSGGRVVSADDLDWLAEINRALTPPSLALDGPPGVRAVMRDQPQRTLIHVYNLNIERLSSFEDRATPANNVHITARVPFSRVKSIRVESADPGAAGPLKFTSTADGAQTVVEFTLPQVDTSSIIVIDGER